MGGTPCWSWERVSSPPLQEEGAAETTGDELTASPIPCPTRPLTGKRQRKQGAKLSLGRRERWGEGVLKVWFYFSLSYFDLIVNKLN